MLRPSGLRIEAISAAGRDRGDTMKEPTPGLRIVITIGVLTAASAYLVSPLQSGTPYAHECVAADRMPLLGCITGEAARQRAQGRWRIDPGIIIRDETWTGP